MEANRKERPIYKDFGKERISFEKLAINIFAMYEGRYATTATQLQHSAAMANGLVLVGRVKAVSVSIGTYYSSTNPEREKSSDMSAQHT